MAFGEVLRSNESTFRGKSRLRGIEREVRTAACVEFAVNSKQYNSTSVCLPYKFCEILTRVKRISIIACHEYCTMKWSCASVSGRFVEIGSPCNFIVLQSTLFPFYFSALPIPDFWNSVYSNFAPTSTGFPLNNAKAWNLASQWNFYRKPNCTVSLCTIVGTTTIETFQHSSRTGSANFEAKARSSTGMKSAWSDRRLPQYTINSRLCLAIAQAI